jgi:hypothetical protein
MALSDCPKCWDTPCMCGYEYERWSDESILKLISVLKRTLDSRKNKSTKTDDEDESGMFNPFNKGE